MTSIELYTLLKDNFNDLFSFDCFTEADTEPISDYLIDSNLPFFMDSGSTKCVIIANDGTFVLKIPFTGYYDDDGDYVPYMSATAPMSPEWDYCAQESYYYYEAVYWDLQNYFAEEYIIGTINDYPIYCQQYASCTNDNKLTLKQEKRARDYKTSSIERSEFCIKDSKWTAHFLECYGEEEYDKLIKFIRHYNINDLHCSNIGYINNFPVLIDYSGYNE